MGIFDEGYQQSNRDTHDNWFDTPPVGFMEGALSGLRGEVKPRVALVFWAGTPLRVLFTFREF